MKGYIPICIVAYAAQTQAVEIMASLTQITTSGAYSPEKIFEWTKDPATNFKVPGSITPLGQRQQYYIGDEMRERYVNDAKFLPFSYDIATQYLQSKYNCRASISLEAQMVGLYPPATSNLKLTEWQQGHALPPLDTSSVAEWVKGLGENALEHGFTPFPINMEGLADDRLLSLSSDNCPLYKDTVAKVRASAAFQAIDKSFADFYVALQNLTGESNVNYDSAQ
jgi:hypothetical protein